MYFSFLPFKTVGHANPLGKEMHKYLSNKHKHIFYECLKIVAHIIKMNGGVCVCVFTCVHAYVCGCRGQRKMSSVTIYSIWSFIEQQLTVYVYV